MGMQQQQQQQQNTTRNAGQSPERIGEKQGVATATQRRLRRGTEESDEEWSVEMN